MIRVEQSFTLYAKCNVIYDGRAKSTLKTGNYLITHKNDGTLRIDGGALCNPLNYQPPGAILRAENKNQLISTRKKEIITINLEKIHFYKELQDWSTNKIKILKTEAQLRDKIANNIEKYVAAPIKEVTTEFKTPIGDIDILAIDVYDTYHIIEVKRGKASLSTCSQLERYSNYFLDIDKNIRDYIASPDISSNALKYTQDHFQVYLHVEHSI